MRDTCQYLHPLSVAGGSSRVSLDVLLSRPTRGRCERSPDCWSQPYCGRRHCRHPQSCRCGRCCPIRTLSCCGVLDGRVGCCWNWPWSAFSRMPLQAESTHGPLALQAVKQRWTACHKCGSFVATACLRVVMPLALSPSMNNCCSQRTSTLRHVLNSWRPWR